MVATKSLLAGVLVAAASLLLGGTAQAGGIITAGSSGTLYYGGNGSHSSSGSTVFVARAIPIAAVAPLSAPPVAPAPAPAAAVQAPAAPQMALAWGASSAPTTAIVSAGTPAVVLPALGTPNPTTAYDAFINFGTAPYADQALLTTGTAQSWTNSPALVSAYQHTPSQSELNDFMQTVLNRVESTFANSGLAIRATLDPNATAGHTLSVVSGLSSTTSPDAIGVTNVGHNGFDFIDKLGYANSPDQLEWAVAHNVAHELMHAFGGSHHTTPEGNNLDAPMSDWSVLTDPATKFSAASVSEMTNNIRNGGLAAKYGYGAESLGFSADGQELSPMPVPEPATFVLWAMAGGLVFGARRRVMSRRDA